MERKIFCFPNWNSIAVSLVLLTITLGGLSDCAFSRGDLGTPLNGTDLSAFKKGQTTEAQVVAILGAPNSIQEIDHRPVFHYFRYSMKHGTVLVFSRVNVASDDLYVFFDHDGLVEQVISTNRTDKLKFQFWPFGQSEND